MWTVLCQLFCGEVSEHIHLYWVFYVEFCVWILGNLFVSAIVSVNIYFFLFSRIYWCLIYLCHCKRWIWSVGLVVKFCQRLTKEVKTLLWTVGEIKKKILISECHWILVIEHTETHRANASKTHIYCVVIKTRMFQSSNLLRSFHA
jgi:hypothetical protein